jgi:hypothetical protein
VEPAASVFAEFELPVTLHRAAVPSYCNVTDVLLGTGRSAPVPVIIRLPAVLSFVLWLERVKV